ncbi:MAG: hypothetical protein JXO22_16505 [Phycisphaerae bacterium]|nr:hypothetical protein [Phycisphaerae bacterium]
MNKRKWILVVLSAGMLLQLGTCLSEVGSYTMAAFEEYLPDLLDTWLETLTASA